LEHQEGKRTMEKAEMWGPAIGYPHELNNI
jgi:hypothetical protein